MKEILLVEDESDISRLMQLHLEREGHRVTAAATGEDGLKHALSRAWDLVILDWMLPGLSGLEICRRIAPKLPVLMVTARTEDSDIVLGLESGAQDYITKPFQVPVFLARVRNILRRSQASPASDALTLGGIQMDEVRHEVVVAGEIKALTVSEFRLLGALLRNVGRVLTRNTLIQLVQGDGVAVTPRTIDTHVFGLRKKLGSEGDKIESIRGVGYRIQGHEK